MMYDEDQEDTVVVMVPWSSTYFSCTNQYQREFLFPEKHKNKKEDAIIMIYLPGLQERRNIRDLIYYDEIDLSCNFF